MKIVLFIGGLFSLSFLTESVSQSNFWRATVRPSLPENFNDQRRFPVPYEEDTSKYLFRNAQERRDVEEKFRTLCEEERKTQDVRELIYANALSFLQSGNDYNLRKYHLIPRKVNVIKCMSKPSEEESRAVCKPENCRERKVDVEVFGRLRNETGNVWEFVGTLSAVPVACECFLRWKPHKCLKTEMFVGL